MWASSLQVSTPLVRVRAGGVGAYHARAAEFSQVGGTFSGTIDVAALEGGSTPSNVVAIEDVLGVVETHYALW